MKITPHRPSATLVVAVLALVVALVSSPLPSQAAKNLIKGRQIAASAISTAKLKTGAVTAPKLANGAVTAPKLANGSVGSAKVADGSLTAADLAPGTLPTAYWAKVQGNEPLLTTYAPVVSVNLPAGTYAVTATASLTNVAATERDGFCQLTDGSLGRGTARPFDISAQRSSTIATTGVFTLTAPATVSLACRASAPTSVYTASGSDPNVLAVRTSGVVDQSP